MTLEQIDLAITKLEETKLAILTGTQRVKGSYQGGSIELATATPEQIEMELTRLRILRSRITGEPSGMRPIRPGFSSRY
jgi:hypothetical protein